jgi:7-cyano-7-deazaguanine reductase
MKKDAKFTKSIVEMSDELMATIITRSFKYVHTNKYRLIPYVGKVRIEVKYKTDELVSVCPATGYPDFYNLIISYIPDKVLPELKALKMHLMEYRNLPISHEHLCAKILKDFINNVEPHHCTVTLTATPRGGITTTVEGDSDNME